MFKKIIQARFSGRVKSLLSETSNFLHLEHLLLYFLNVRDRAVLYTGSTRKMKIWESEILTINVKPGWKKGTKITFPDKGNEQPNQLPADLVFVIDEKPHDLYKRDGDDHIVNRKVSVTSRGTWGTPANLTTLDGRNLSMPTTDIIHWDMSSLLLWKECQLQRSLVIGVILGSNLM
ncbi:hypothetical protein V6N12_051873 [Hibiscus sabdariffa]|uniref:Chaperone DnaJ C-terminal domain-containing protein n=1 Tax=Hibiscus sabdariffa TaxID=183260 RepID=A0ABR2GHF0_9ROSI